MRIKIAKYYVCRDCGRKAQTSLGFPTDWMLVLVSHSDQWEVLCPASHTANKYGNSNSTTTSTGYYKYYPKDFPKKFNADFMEHMDEEEDDDTE